MLASWSLVSFTVQYCRIQSQSTTDAETPLFLGLTHYGTHTVHPHSLSSPQSGMFPNIVSEVTHHQTLALTCDL